MGMENGFGSDKTQSPNLQNLFVLLLLFTYEVSQVASWTRFVMFSQIWYTPGDVKVSNIFYWDHMSDSPTLFRTKWRLQPFRHFNILVCNVTESLEDHLLEGVKVLPAQNSQTHNVAAVPSPLNRVNHKIFELIRNQMHDLNLHSIYQFKSIWDVYQSILFGHPTVRTKIILLLLLNKYRLSKNAAQRAHFPQ